MCLRHCCCSSDVVLSNRIRISLREDVDEKRANAINALRVYTEEDIHPGTIPLPLVVDTLRRTALNPFFADVEDLCRRWRFGDSVDDDLSLMCSMEIASYLFIKTTEGVDRLCLSIASSIERILGSMIRRCLRSKVKDAPFVSPWARDLSRSAVCM